MKNTKNSPKMSKRQRELAGTPIDDIGFEVKTWHRTLAQMAKNGYADTHPAVVTMRQNLAALNDEMERREGGGKILADIRKPYMTDGDYLAAGLEPPTWR